MGDKIKSIELSMYQQALIAIVEYSSGKKETLLGQDLNVINDKLDEYAKEKGKTVADLFGERLVSVDPNKAKTIAARFNLEGNNIVKKKTVTMPTPKKDEKPTESAERPSDEIPSAPPVESEPELHEDGSLDAVETPVATPRRRRADRYTSDAVAREESKPKKKKGISKFKRYGAAVLVATLIGGAGYAGYKLAGGSKNAINNNTNRYTNAGNTNNQQNNVQNNTNNAYQANIQPGRYDAVGSSVANESIDGIIEYANFESYENISEIYSFLRGADLEGQPELCDVQNTVSDRDRAAVALVVELKNRIVNNTYNSRDRVTARNEAMFFLNQFCNYVFENGNMLNGQTVKTYDSLSPYAQYVVNVLGQSVLQLCPDYIYQSPSNTFDFNNLMALLNNNVNDSYTRVVSASGKTI